MGTEVIALGASFLASVFAFGVFMWRVFVKVFEQFGAKIDQQFVNLDDRFSNRFEILDRRIDEKIQPIEAKVDKLDAKVDGLAKDHQTLARELAEFRGEVRGRFAELSLPGPQAPAPT